MISLVREKHVVNVIDVISQTAAVALMTKAAYYFGRHIITPAAALHSNVLCGLVIASIASLAKHIFGSDEAAYASMLVSGFAAWGAHSFFYPGINFGALIGITGVAKIVAVVAATKFVMDTLFPYTRVAPTATGI